ncbi:MAG: hemerythrin family protein [Bacteroidales bacterium]|nr:hemerythrin family protein [Bacteroidales bacterium]
MSKILINWTDTYSIGYSEIDNQHKKLVEMINVLYNAFSQGAVENVIRDILDEMIKYTDYHFKNEEKYFEKYAYSDAQEHIKQHEEFVLKVTDFYQEYNRGSETLTYDIMHFLRDWLLEHIKDSDRKYSSEFQEKSIVEL